MGSTYRNISFATVESFDEVLRQGTPVRVRGEDTKELRNRVTILRRPTERCLFIPGRGNDIFHQVAETLWVLAGRNDLPWLTRYLPKAVRFSTDNGQTWHGAYGPRLRAWSGVDQVDEWRRLLLQDSTSRRSAGVIFDPARDYAEGLKDVPCNNWLSWMLRDDRLHLTVGIRSNDALWGFSGINAFEWSVLQEMMAHWLSSAVGNTTFIATSYHLYADKFEQAERVVSRFHGVSPYDFSISPPQFATRWEEFDSALSSWFRAEEHVRSAPGAPLPDCQAMQDPFLASALRLVRLRWGSDSWTVSQIADELAALPEDDFAAAAYEKMARKHPGLLENICQPNIRAFFAACDAAKHEPHDLFKRAITDLHAVKNASYAAAWKRRGERISVLPNIARKIDRLDSFRAGGATMDDETVFDTVLDLFVYAAKYVLFLAEQAQNKLEPLGDRPPTPLSDHDENFNALVRAAKFEVVASGTFNESAAQAVETFEVLWRSAERGDPASDRLTTARTLLGHAEEMLGRIAVQDPRSAAAFVRHTYSKEG